MAYPTLRLALIAALLGSAPAFAQEATRIANCGNVVPPAGVGTVYVDAFGNLCIASTPFLLRGQGTFSASTSSAAINAALTVTANSAAFPTGPLGGPLTIEPQGNASTGVYVCWQGGTCTAAIGEYLAPGVARTMSIQGQNMTTNPPTVISTGTPAVVVEW